MVVFVCSVQGKIIPFMHAVLITMNTWPHTYYVQRILKYSPEQNHSPIQHHGCAGGSCIHMVTNMASSPLQPWWSEAGMKVVQVQRVKGVHPNIHPELDNPIPVYSNLHYQLSRYRNKVHRGCGAQCSFTHKETSGYLPGLAGLNSGHFNPTILLDVSPNRIVLKTHYANVNMWT